MAGSEVEFAVVGAGAFGLSAAHALARRGRQVVVCDQDTVGHAVGGSKGSARIFRFGYDDPAYVRLAVVALRLWRRLEAESGTALVTTTGQVTFGDDLDLLVAALSEAGAAHELMAAPEVTARYPALSVPGMSVFEPESGVIAADAFLAALRRRDGIEMREKTRVVRCRDDGDSVLLSLESAGTADRLRASVVVVCAGPWTAPLVSGPTLGLHPLASLEQVAYLAPAGATTALGAESDGFPVFVERRRPWFYGLPVGANGLVKVALHGGGPAVRLEDLEKFRHHHRRGDGTVDSPDPSLVAQLADSARRVLPGLDPEPVATERCLYDNSADGDFVIDRVGNIVIGAGSSGHGFKFAPLLGELLADLATGADHSPELGPAEVLARFALARLRSSPDTRRPGVHR